MALRRSQGPQAELLPPSLRGGLGVFLGPARSSVSSVRPRTRREGALSAGEPLGTWVCDPPSTPQAGGAPLGSDHLHGASQLLRGVLPVNRVLGITPSIPPLGNPKRPGPAAEGTHFL